MQRKLKSVFRSSSKRKSKHAEETARHSQSSDRTSASLDAQRRPQTADAYTTNAQQNGHSRNISSGHDSRPAGRVANAPPVAVDYARSHPTQQAYPTQSAQDSITSDYKAYLPVLSSAEDSRDEKYSSLGGDRRLITGESELRHEEDVADRNIDRYGSSHEQSKRTSIPSAPVPYAQGQDSQRRNDRIGSVGSVPSLAPSVATGATGKYSLGQDTATHGGLMDRILPHAEATAHEKNQWKNQSWPAKTARAEPQVAPSGRKPRGSETEDGEHRSPADDLVNHHHIPSKSQGAQREAETAGNAQNDIGKEIERLLDGVVDLRNTVDEDKVVQWAPAVTHEVVKPHEHEIIQHKIYREIHNYEYHHRVQPVYDIEVLPPRHWRPNPNGDGLIEISADAVPSRTGNNRRWKIIHEQVELPAESMPVWRTEPEIIEHPTSITEEGFERRETTIIYPPTLQDMTEYDGPVQPVHFDHKTGKRWLGEITTMHKLRHELGQLADPDISLKELGDSLPEVPRSHEVPELSHSPELKRKPLNGPVPAQLGDLGRHEGIAVAV